MNIKEVEKLLKKEGWFEVSQKGSHRKFKHDVKKGIVIVPIHKGDVPIGTLNSIKKQAGLI